MYTYFDFIKVQSVLNYLVYKLETICGKDFCNLDNSSPDLITDKPEATATFYENISFNLSDDEFLKDKLPLLSLSLDIYDENFVFVMYERICVVESNGVRKNQFLDWRIAMHFLSVSCDKVVKKHEK